MILLICTFFGIKNRQIYRSNTVSINEQAVANEIYNSDVECECNARTRLLLLRQPRRGSRIRLGRQPFTARNPTGRQIYLYLHQSGFLRSFSTGSRLDNRRRRRRPTSPLLPLRPNRHPA